MSLPGADLQGANIFIVERDTGFIIACDNVTMPLMSEDQQVRSHSIHDQATKLTHTCYGQPLCCDAGLGTAPLGHP